MVRRRPMEPSVTAPEPTEGEQSPSVSPGQALVRVDESPVTHWLSSGSDLIDLAISDRLPGGFPAGRYIHVYGLEATGKTLLACEPMGSAQRQGGVAFFEDAEGTFDPVRGEKLHSLRYEPSRWRYQSPEGIEQLWDGAIASAVETLKKRWGRKPLEKQPPSVMVVDSLAALCSEEERKERLEKGTYGQQRASRMSKAFRKYRKPIAGVNLCVLFVDQVRDNIGNPFDPYTTSGGRALKFYASTRLMLTQTGKIKQKDRNGNDHVIGIRGRCRVDKDKVGVPFREVPFQILFEYGVDNTAGNLLWLYNNDPFWLRRDLVLDDAEDEAILSLYPEKREVRDDGKATQLGDSTLARLVAAVESADLEAALTRRVERVWRYVFLPLDRKPRVRT